MQVVHLVHESGVSNRLSSKEVMIDGHERLMQIVVDLTEWLNTRQLPILRLSKIEHEPTCLTDPWNLNFEGPSLQINSSLDRAHNFRNRNTVFIMIWNRDNSCFWWCSFDGMRHDLNQRTSAHWNKETNQFVFDTKRTYKLKALKLPPGLGSRRASIAVSFNKLSKNLNPRANIEADVTFIFTASSCLHPTTRGGASLGLTDGWN